MKPGCPIPIVLLSSLLLVTASCSSAGDSSVSERQSYSETIRGSDVQFDMIWIPRGGFWIGRTEVTWDEYLLYCDFEESGKVPPGADAVTKPSKPLEVTPYDRDWGAGKRPTVGLSWNAARKYCNWLSLNTGKKYRLPTETEWELACGQQPLPPLSDHAWYAENTDGRTQEVGKKRPNEFGLHDMLGNLWEYCANPYSPEEPERAVLRGGSWNDPAASLTSRSRLGFDDTWVLADPNVPPGVWWAPDAEVVGFRVLRRDEN